LFITALKYSNLLRFRLKRQRPDTSVGGIHRLRETTEKSSGLMGKLPKSIEIEPCKIGDMYAEWLVPRDARDTATLLYFHGGGYVIGSAKGHRAIAAKFALGSKTRTLVFSYALAPEKPFPAALDNAIEAYQYLLSVKFEPSHIAFMGDSAGGGLCLATLLSLRERALPLPSAAVALSPWTDLKNTGKSLQSNLAADSLTWKDSWIDFSRYYIGDNDRENPLISPLYGDLHGLPPLLIYAGNDELLRDDSIRFAQKAREADVDTTLHVGEGMFHCYPACAPMFPEATAARDEICAFIQNYTTFNKGRSHDG
jgi:acetyl esterase/lipase